MANSSALLSVQDLSVEFTTEDGIVHAVSNLSYEVSAGKTLAIVGESGSGKSVSSLAIMGLLKSGKAKVTGEVYFDGRELVGSDPEELRLLRGREMAMIFQDPLSALHPFYRIGAQLVEAVQVHQSVDDNQALNQARTMLERVGIPSVDRVLRAYPHELSGGMRQRVMIAMALINDPKVLIADEPTTALDVTVQAQILQLLKDLQSEFNTAIVLITHDLGVVADMADEVVVMYGGSAVEHAPVRELFYQPQMPYTWGLLDSIPQVQGAGNRLEPIPGSPPSLINMPAGCVFAPRCKYANTVGQRCLTELPQLLDVTPVHQARCHLSVEQRKSFRPEKSGGAA